MRHPFLLGAELVKQPSAGHHKAKEMFAFEHTQQAAVGVCLGEALQLVALAASNEVSIFV